MRTCSETVGIYALFKILGFRKHEACGKVREFKNFDFFRPGKVVKNLLKKGVGNSITVNGKVMKINDTL